MTKPVNAESMRALTAAAVAQQEAEALQAAHDAIDQAVNAIPSCAARGFTSSRIVNYKAPIHKVIGDRKPEIEAHGFKVRRCEWGYEITWSADSTA